MRLAEKMKMTLRAARQAGRSNGRRTGLSVLEMTMVLMLLSLLTFGAMEFGYYFFLKNSVEGAAREGVRAAIPSGAVFGDIDKACLQQLRDVAGLLPSTATTCASSNYTVKVQSIAALSATTTNLSSWPTIANSTQFTGIPSGDPVAVSITYTWGTVGIRLLPVMSPISTTKSVTCTAVMRKE